MSKWKEPFKSDITKEVAKIAKVLLLSYDFSPFSTLILDFSVKTPCSFLQ